MDLDTLDDTQLADLLNAVINEQERRQRRDQAPTQITDLARRYLDDGGNPANLPDLAALPSDSTT